MECSDPEVPEERMRQQAARVFLGEDDSEMRSLVAAALRRDGHEVIEAADGLDLLFWVESQQASALRARRDVVVTDVRMPGASGLEVLAALRHSQPTIPVVIVTGFGDADTHFTAHWLGASAVFDKPFDLAALRKTVLRLSLSGPMPVNNNGVS